MHYPLNIQYVFDIKTKVLEIILLNEGSQKEKDKYHMISLICGIQNMTQINLSMKQKRTHRHREQTCSCGGWGGLEWEFGVSRCKLLYIGWINNRVLLYSTGNSIQYPEIKHNGKEYKKECIYMYN